MLLLDKLKAKLLELKDVLLSDEALRVLGLIMAGVMLAGLAPKATGLLFIVTIALSVHHLIKRLK